MSGKRTALLLTTLALGACEAENEFARVIVIDAMSQTIGGPAAIARPGDYLLENDRIRAVVHGRHNMRSTNPIANGSLVDLDLQRPHHRYGVGRGKDAFYELGPMINLKVNSSDTMARGLCGEVGVAPCPDDNKACVRVTVSGKGDNIAGIIGLLDFAIQTKADGKEVYNPAKLQLATDYDLCPGERFVRVTTSAHFEDDPTKSLSDVEMDELRTQTGILDVMLGEHTGQDCAKQPCPLGESCDELLLGVKVSGLNLEMKRCRKPEQKLAGILAGDLTLFSGKVNVFVPGNGFDHESYIRSMFDAGGDVFSNPLSMRYVVAVADGVSYAYFNGGGEVMIPVFSDTFTVSMTSRYACKRSEPECLKGRRLRYRRFVSVGRGDAASALQSVYKVQGIPFGQVEGHVVDARDRKPMSGVDVFAYRVPAAWDTLSDSAVGAMSHEQLLQQQKLETATEQNPEGLKGIISHFRTDVGMDQVKDGSFSGPLPVSGPSSISCPSPECRYILVAQTAERGPSGLYPVRVRKNQISRLTMLSAHTSTLQFDVQDATGRPLPSKLTIGHCFAECARDADCAAGQRCEVSSRLCQPGGGYRGAGDCRPDQLWDPTKGTCICRTEGRLSLAHGGSRFADNTVQAVRSTSGKGQVRLEPGSYQVVISRGFEYEIDRQFVTLRPGMLARIKSVLPRVVNTRGWISADFHVHGPNSVDSGMGFDDRVASYVSEGVELLSASDHDFLTDYGPTIYKLGLQDWVKSQIGVEVSPLDYGHFIGFPLRFDENAELNGAFHWREDDPPGWKHKTPSGIFKRLREIGSLGIERTVVFVAHFYDHFTFYSINPSNMRVDFSFTAMLNPILSPANFSGNFDALEAFNGKNFDIIRRPTYAEVSEYNLELAKLLKSKAESYDARQQQLLDLSAAYQRRFVERTAEEQPSALGFSNPYLQCRCAADEECGPGSVCAAETGACIAGCTGDEECDAALVSAGREACKQKGSDPARKVCQRLPQSCTVDTDCTVAFGVAKEVCRAGQCELACVDDTACKDAMRPRCDASKGLCSSVLPAAGTDPCVMLRGTVDDWFQLLNRGIRRPILGNSDSHGGYGTEAGIPRNYVASSTDLPQHVKSGEVADQVHAMHSFPTYGPFVELTTPDGQSYGAVIKAKQGDEIALKLRVQSPRWFDVDRIEVYRNGQQIQVISGSESCSDRSKCIRLPNDHVVNFEGTIRDRPDRDAWYVVAVMGLDGKTMAPVYSSTPVARLGMFELIQRLTPMLPPLRALRTPLSPSMAKVRPYAMTNPIWVDIGGDGLSPVAEPPGWVTERDRAGMKRSALTQSSQTHDHRPGLGKMVLDAARFGQLVKEGAITLPMLQQMMEQLRYYGR